MVSFAYQKIIGKNKFSVKGNKNKIELGTSIIRNSTIVVKGNFNEIIIDKHCILNQISISIFGNKNKIIIGDYSYFNEAEFWIEDDYNSITVGEKTTIHGKTQLACIEGCNIEIGQDCMFSTDVVFRTGDSHSIIDKNGKRINKSKSIKIGNHVWFGSKTIINKGVEILDSCIVGTGSVVTNSFDKAGVILVGSPARIIKENINWLRERI